jgi:hypothetical protein
LSFEELITGAGSLRASNPSAFTGAGVGIGVLDSGVDTCHAAFGGKMNGNSGSCKASGRISATPTSPKISSTSLPDWTHGKDLSLGYAPGSNVYKALQKFWTTRASPTPTFMVTARTWPR